MRHFYILMLFSSLIKNFDCGWTMTNHTASSERNRPMAEKELVTNRLIPNSRTTNRSRRYRRDIWQLYGVITCTTPCEPLVLKDYGCYCGLGGTGSPVDPIDRCCMLHDYCYHNAPCHQALTYFLPYNWKCIAGRPYCSTPPRWTPAYTCSLHLCECDRLFSECLHSYGCPKEKAVCISDRFRRMWQKLLIKLGIG